jgi:hypothetical protein
MNASTPAGPVTVRQRASSSPSLAKVCGTPGGTRAKKPWLEDGVLFAERELEGAVEDEERLGCPAVEVERRPGVSREAGSSRRPRAVRRNPSPPALTIVVERRSIRSPSPAPLSTASSMEAAAVGRRVELVEVLDAAADVVAEAHGGRVDVEEDRGGVAGVSGRCGRPRAVPATKLPGACGARLQVGPERELEVALEEVEGVGVVSVDVRVGALLARLVPEPGHDQLFRLGLDPQRPLPAVGDRLALAGR